MNRKDLVADFFNGKGIGNCLDLQLVGDVIETVTRIYTPRPSSSSSASSDKQNHLEPELPKMVAEEFARVLNDLRSGTPLRECAPEEWFILVCTAIIKEPQVRDMLTQRYNASRARLDMFAEQGETHLYTFLAGQRFGDHMSLVPLKAMSSMHATYPTPTEFANALRDLYCDGVVAKQTVSYEAAMYRLIATLKANTRPDTQVVMVPSSSSK
jgi:hypothetical protein